MKHIIIATDKKTGFKRHFEFEGNIFVDGLIVEEILTEPLETEEKGCLCKQRPPFAVQEPAIHTPTRCYPSHPKIKETHKQYVIDFYLASKVDELIRAFNTLQEK